MIDFVSQNQITADGAMRWFIYFVVSVLVGIAGAYLWMRPRAHRVDEGKDGPGSLLWSLIHIVTFLALCRAAKAVWG